MNVKIDSDHNIFAKWNKAKSLPKPWMARLQKLPGKAVWIALSIVVALAAGGFSYYRFVHQTGQSTTSSTLQTAAVRQGDLVLYASGTGTLVSENEVDLAFGTSGQVTQVLVKVGDQVQAGDVLAQVDDTDAQVTYTETNRALVDLTDISAVASAQENMATAALDLQDAINHLEYLISPTVYYWEGQVADAEQAVKEAQAAADAAPSSQEALDALKRAQEKLAFFKDNLASAQVRYEKYYVPQNFTVKTFNKTSRKMESYVSAPSEYDILEARSAVTVAQASLQEYKNLYTALTGGEVPEDATGTSLTALANAKIALKSAQHTLDGTRIVAPFSGTVMAVDTRVGDTVTSSTTVITLADLSHPYLEVYLDTSDWSLIKAGEPVEVTFDMLPDQTYSGTVTSIDPGLYTESNSSVVRAYVELDATQADFNIPLGASAAADVIGGQAREAVLVPVAALHKAGDGYAVFVMENGKPVLRTIEVGIQDANYAEVKSGLQVGETVTTGLAETSSQ